MFRLIRQLIKYTLLVILIVTSLLTGLTLAYRERVATLFIEEIGSRKDIDIELSGARLTLFRRFPRASFELNGVVVKPLTGESINDTLLVAERLSLDFSLTDLLKRDYTIERIIVENGELNIVVDSAGRANYPSLSPLSSSERDNLSINIQQIRLSSVGISVSNRVKNITAAAEIESARLSGEIAGREIGLKADAGFNIVSLLYDGIELPEALAIDLSLDLFRSDTTLTLKSGRMVLEGMRFDVSGDHSLLSGETHVLLKSENADIRVLAGFLPDDYSSALLKYRPSGKLDAEGVISGVFSRTTRLNYTFGFRGRDIRVTLPGTSLTLSDGSFSGRFSNGRLNSAHTTELLLSDIDVRSPLSEAGGSLHIKNFTDPVVAADITIGADAQELLSLFTDPPATNASGRLRASVRGEGPLPSFSDFNSDQLLAMGPSGNVTLSNFGFTREGAEFSQISGDLMLLETLWIDSLLVTLNDQHFLINGSAERFGSLLRGEGRDVTLKGVVMADHLEPGLLPRASGRGERREGRFTLPENLEADLAFAAASFRHRTFSASDITATVHYSNKRATLYNAYVRSMGGEVSGEIVMEELPEGGFLTECRLVLENIDINNAFTSFNNFSQEFIGSDNLSGILSGTYGMAMNLDHDLRPDLHSINSEGHFIIADGELIDFEPVLNLSRFIDIAELQHIKFSRLENRFFINGGVFSIPHMDISSSAADLGISGTHAFNGDYDYRLRVLLSQLLSRQAPRRTPNNEFGIVEDDGLGRTSVYLRTRREGDNESISWDAAATRAHIVDDIQRERQTVRSILREEYGLFSSDTTILPTEEEVRRPPVRIMWDEAIIPGGPADTIRQDTTRRERRGNPIRDLFNRIVKG